LFGIFILKGVDLQMPLTYRNLSCFLSCHFERSEESIFGVLFFNGTKMDSSLSAQNDNTLCGNAYRHFGCTLERQGATDYDLQMLLTHKCYCFTKPLEHFANEIAQCSGGGYPSPAPQA
jgi:hypothetical protein